LRGMFGSLEGFDEAKALEMKAPKGVAESEPARLEWLKTKTAGLPLKQRNTLLRQAFGPTYPYVNKMLFEPTSPELQQELNYAASPQAAAEAAQNAAAYRGTAEGQTEISKGKSIRPEGSFSPDDITNVLTRDKGKAYLEYLKIHDPKKYASLQFRGSPFGMGIGAIINESPEELAAMELWQMTLPAKTSAKEKVGGFLTESHRWHELPPAEQLAGAEQGSRMININYNTNTIYNPVAGTAADRDIGPRADRDLK